MVEKLGRAELAYQLGATFKYQQAVINCPDRFRTVRKPRQLGMTTCFAIEALVDAITYDDYIICIVSPTKRQSGRMMQYIKKAFYRLERIYKQKIPTAKFTTEEVYFHHGSEIHSLPNNPAGIEGFDCNHGIIDEAGLFVLTEGERIIDSIVGSLAAKQGRLTVSGRPHGKRGLLWQYWDGSNEKYAPFTHFKYTWKDRAAEDSKYGVEVGRHKKILTKLQFAEVYDAEFIEEGILVFPHALLEPALTLWDKENYIIMHHEGTPQLSRARYVGVDFGRKRNLTEIHVLQKESNGTLRTLMMHTLSKTNFELQKKYIDDLMVRVNPIQMRIDERGMGLPLLDYFENKHGKRVQPLGLKEGASKEKLILQCRNAFADGIIAIPHNDTLYEQLHCFQKDYTDKGNVVYSGKVDETDFMDDKVIALVAAVEAAQSQPFKFGVS